MRDIKFRAWVDNGSVSEMIYSDKTDIKSAIAYALWFRLVYNHNPENLYISDWQKEIIFLQYTGLKDKNGVEIYEGDIVKDSEQTYIVRFGELATAVCVFIGFYLEHLVYIEFSGPLSSFDSDVLEVIGNVHQNPELLK